MSFWFDDAKRLQVAKQFQQARIEYLKQVWAKDRDLKAISLWILCLMWLKSKVLVIKSNCSKYHESIDGLI